MGRTPYIRRSATHGQQSILIVSWQQNIPIRLKPGVSMQSLLAKRVFPPLHAMFLVAACLFFGVFFACLHAVKVDALLVFLSS